ncbi:MAG: hypothetical protein EA427_02575 [Spirochaetaceae bacterium]|nr:MAG: hypothetical protein EA427_02575 [Spirochaetaceae bacterium]
MKMSPQYTRAQANMQPGVITSDGFLGDDHRNLVDIIEADEEKFSQLDLDFDHVARRLRSLLEAGRKGLGEPVTIEGKWIITTSEARGHLASPFEDGIYRKVNARIEYAPQGKPTGEELLISDLSLHLLETHHFLQGKGSPFRIEPEKIRKVLEI